MFSPPELPKPLVYFGPIGEVKKLHSGQDFSTRLEEEIRIHQGQIQAENLLLNTVAKYQHIARANGASREELNRLLHNHHYKLDAIQQAMMQNFGIPASAFSAPVDFEPIDTADYMRQRAAMMGAVLSSTPVLLRDPWGGKSITVQYGFTDFKAEVDGISFSAIATPRYKGIPFRFAVMKHEHDGFTDNNPAMIMSDEFCDAFGLYNAEQYGNRQPEDNPLIIAMAKNLKPNIHDRFHNWLLYDVQAASDVFRQWGNDIYFVEHADKNPLLINYEYVAMCFHLYGYQMLFDKNPNLKGDMYRRLENCIAEIEQFGRFLGKRTQPKAAEIQESTVYAVLSNICFVLDPYEDRFQNLLEPYPDVRQKLLEVRHDGKGIGHTLQRLHGYEDGIPSQKYGGAPEAVIEYILRYPLVDEIRTKLKVQRSDARPDDWQVIDGKRIYTMNLESYLALPPALKDQIHTVNDSGVFAKINAALRDLPEPLRQGVIQRTEVSEEGYFFLRLDREEIDYTQFETRTQDKRILLIDIPDGRESNFTNDKKLSIKDRVKKQDFHLIGGKDVLAINVRDETAASEILDYARTEDGIDPELAIAKAKELAAMTGEKSAGDLYKIERNVAVALYNFTTSDFYQATLEKFVAQSPGPVIMQLRSGGDQRLIKGAFVYLALGEDPATDPNPDCHLIENVDYQRDYGERTDILRPMRLRENSSLIQNEGDQDEVNSFLKTLHKVNYQITHGAAALPTLSSHLGLFS